MNKDVGNDKNKTSITFSVPLSVSQSESEEHTNMNKAGSEKQNNKKKLKVMTLSELQASAGTADQKLGSAKNEKKKKKDIKKRSVITLSELQDSIGAKDRQQQSARYEKKKNNTESKSEAKRDVKSSLPPLPTYYPQSDQEITQPQAESIPLEHSPYSLPYISQEQRNTTNASADQTATQPEAEMRHARTQHETAQWKLPYESSSDTSQEQRNTENTSDGQSTIQSGAPITREEPVITPQEQRKKKRRMSIGWVLLIILVLVCIGLYFVGTIFNWFSSNPSPEPTVLPLTSAVVTDTLQETPQSVSPTPTYTPQITSPPPATTNPATDSPAGTDSNAVLPVLLVSTTAPPAKKLQTPVPQPEETTLPEVDGWGASQSDTSPYHTEYPWPAPRLMSGIYSRLGMYVSLPDYIRANTAALQISYTCSDLILDSISSLTFYVNDTPIYSCPVKYSPSGPVLLSIEVPIELLKENFNLIEIRGYSRLNDDDNCMDEYAEANWIQFREQTCLRIGYDLVEDCRESLHYFPFPFVSIQDTTGEETSIAIPEGINESELGAALLIMARLGSAVSVENEIVLTTWSDVSDSRVIFVGLDENLPAEIQQLTSGVEIPPDSALIYSVYTGEKEYLLLIGKTPQSLNEAAQLISDPNRVKQLMGNKHIVMPDASAAILEQAALSDTVVQNNYTLKDILGHGLDFVGPFHQEVSINLPTSSDYTLSGQCKFTFHMRYSDNLDFDRSLMTVYIDDVPIFSKKLTAEGAEGDSVTFLPPADMVGQQISFIRITFDLEIEDLDCTPRQLDTPWAHITEDSTFYLPQGDSALLSLSNLPSPFQRNGVLDSVMAVIPDQPSASDILLLGRMVSVLGSGSSPYGTLVVRRARDFDMTEADYNLIVVGGGENKLITSLNDTLLIAYNDSFSAFVSNEKLVLDDTYAQTLGVIELLQSPYDSQRAVLVLSAPTEGGIQRLIQLVSQEVMLWNLAGDAVVIDSKEDISSYEFQGKKASNAQEPTLLTSISQNSSSIIFAMIGIAVMIILLLAVVMVLIRIRIRNKQ